MPVLTIQDALSLEREWQAINQAAAARVAQNLLRGWAFSVLVVLKGTEKRYDFAIARPVINLNLSRNLLRHWLLPKNKRRPEVIAPVLGWIMWQFGTNFFASFEKTLLDHVSYGYKNNLVPAN